MSISSFMRRNIPKFAIGAAALLAASVSANAVTYDLTSDFSNTANPNGDWSLIYSGSPLPYQSSAQSNGNPYLPAIPAAGYFSVGNDLNAPPFVNMAAVNGSSAALTNNDFLAGDIIVHAPNNGAAVSVVWTAPTAGIISDLFAAVWYAHSSVTRSNEVELVLVATQLAAWTVSTSSNPDRSSPGTYQPGGTFNVSAGDMLILNFTKTAGQTFGSLKGVQENFTFTPGSAVPLPAALPLFAGGLGVMGLLGWRRKRIKSAATAAA